jgi:hypothetical protein
VRALGHPKFDGYADKSTFVLPKDVQKLAAGRKIVLWKMHFPDTKWHEQRKIQTTPCLEEYIKFADWAKTCGDIFFIFMPHPLMAAGGSKEIFRPQIEALMAILNSAPNVWIDLANDYRHSLLNAQAIIIDRSALMVEAGIAGVPVLYMYNREYSEKLTNAIAPLVKSYYQGCTADDMIRFVEMFKQGRDPNAETRLQSFRECVPFADGKCGLRIADDIATGIYAEQPRSVYKIAIFAIGEVFCHYWETTGLLRANAVEIVVFSDNDSKWWGKRFSDIPIVEPSALRNYDFDFLVIFSEQFYLEIFKQLAFGINLDMDKIMRLDKFLVWLSDLKDEKS